jgi:hypothetical protein
MRTIRLLTVVAASALVLAACGSSSNSGSASNAAASAGGGKQAAFLAFSQCMRAHGVPNFPDIRQGMQIRKTPDSTTVNGVQINSPAFQSAMQTCRSKLPNGGRPGPLTASQRQAMLKFSQCMRSHGVPNFPDPTFHGAAVGIELTPGSGVDPNSPAFKSAQKACGMPFGKAS